MVAGLLDQGGDGAGLSLHSSDPLLDAQYHLGAGSPAIDQGTASGAPADDLDGDARPAGAGVDIGADERE